MSNNNKPHKKENKILLSLLVLVLIIAISVVALIFLLKKDSNKEDNTLAYTDLIKEISYGNVEKIEMTVGSTTLKVKMKNDEVQKTAIGPKHRSFYRACATKSC